MLPQRQKLNFRHVHFLCDFCAISGGYKAAVRLERKAAARLLLGTQGVRTTDVRVCHTRIQKPQDFCEITAQWPCALFHGVQRRMISVDNVFVFLRLLFCCVVAI